MSAVNHMREVTDYLLALQNRIVAELEHIDGRARFAEDNWERDGGGGGRSRVLRDGAVFEQAGVNYSHVFGTAMPPSATKHRPELAGREFQAAGVSLVLHPSNPYVPTAHANFRYFVAGGDKPAWWFGGGYDLTPCYPFLDDVLHWHRAAKAACDTLGPDTYARYKAWCDEYFYLRHRKNRGASAAYSSTT